MTLLDVLAVGAGLSLTWIIFQSRRPDSHYLPPGPKGLPIIGVRQFYLLPRIADADLFPFVECR